jgi:hypothetical protein
MLGMTLFPFIAKPVLEPIMGREDNYRMIMEQRKKLIPGWIKMMLETA